MIRSCTRALPFLLLNQHQWSTPSYESRIGPKTRTALCEQWPYTRHQAAASTSTGGGDKEAPRHHDSNARTRTIAADKFYKQHGHIPKPPIVHAVLPKSPPTADRKGILVIGDVHGCFDELLELVEQAQEHNDGVPFLYIILVGDLSNKGPKSAQVIRHVRLHGPDFINDKTDTVWLSIRGNHDDSSLAAALGDEKHRSRKVYQWVLEGEGRPLSGKGPSKDTITLSDEDVEWWSQLPYTIPIPGELLGEDVDSVIVHAGIIPDVSLEQQTLETMTHLREVEQVIDKIDQNPGEFRSRNKHSSAEQLHPWASVWNGPFQKPLTVIFGHDARRGLQLHDWAIGLDTGACYGGKLTGIILPQQKLLHVEAKKMYTKPGGKQ